MTASPCRFREPSSTEAIYIRTGTQIVSRSSVLGTITAGAFIQALIALEARYPILRAAVQAGHFVERPAGTSAPVTWLPASTAAEAVYETLFDTRLDLESTLYSVFVIIRADDFDIILLTSHAITDATSLVELHSALIYLCDCILRDVPPLLAEQPFPETIDDAIDRCLTLLGHDERTPTGEAQYTGSFLQLPALPGAGAQPELRHRLHRLVIEADDIGPAIDLSHAHAVSLHCLLAAVFGRAIQQLSEVESNRILLRCSVDLRRRLEPHLSTDLVFSAVTAHATLVEDMSLPIFAVARAVHDDIQASTRNGRVFMDYQSYPKSFGRPQDMPAALNISDMGRVAFHGAIEHLRPTGFDYALGWAKPYPNVSVTIHDGRLVANTTYLDSVIDRQVIERMAALVLQNLRDCASAHLATA